VNHCKAILLDRSVACWRIQQKSDRFECK